VSFFNVAVLEAVEATRDGGAAAMVAGNDVRKPKLEKYTSLSLTYNSDAEKAKEGLLLQFICMNLASAFHNVRLFKVPCYENK
jgi:hypothetical protein